MIDIYAHGLTVKVNEDTEEVLDINGFGWENEPFTVHLTKEMAADLLWQLNFFAS